MVGSPFDPSQDPFGILPTMSGEDIIGAATQQVIPRDAPEPEPARAALVEAWQGRMKSAEKHWEPVFKAMREAQQFARGRQWSKDKNDARYVANITLRSIQQRTAFLYAKNPRFIAKRRERMLYQVWDENQTTLDQAQMMGAMAMEQAQQGLMDPAQVEAMAGPLMAMAQDAAQGKAASQQLDKISKTLQLLYEYNVAEQAHDFKQMMKMVVRRACTNGVAYVKIGFQRVMDKRPEVEAQLSDISDRLQTLERLAADVADEKVQEHDAEVEQLRLMAEDLRQQTEFIVREGLIFDYPLSTAIIPDPKTIHLKGFLGSDWVAQVYILSPNEVKEIYGVDVTSRFISYSRQDGGLDVVAEAGRIMVRNTGNSRGGKTGNDQPCAKIWEIYNRKDGLVYVVCDGYPDFLREPGEPDIKIDRFYPWYPLAFNEVESETEIFPPSDVDLIRDQQLEYNRCRQGLREHRKAMRPKTIAAAGTVDEEDLAKLESHPANAVLELNGLQPGQRVDDLLQAWTGPKIDPNIYEVNPVYEDILRTTGIQEANLGGTSNATATQTQIAESSRSTAMGSSIDDLDDLLTQLARSGGQILLQEVSVDTVKRIVGPGAVWPEMTRQQIADEIWLEIEAGSTGRPNQQRDIANAERIFPLLMQLPGIDPNFLAKELLRRLDDSLDLTQAFKSQAPSIVAMNSQAKGPPAGPGGAPGAPAGPPGGRSPQAQGPQGQDNGARAGRPGGGPVPDQETGAAPPRPPGLPN